MYFQHGSTWNPWWCGVLHRTLKVASSSSGVVDSSLRGRIWNCICCRVPRGTFKVECFLSLKVPEEILGVNMGHLRQVLFLSIVNRMSFLYKILYGAGFYIEPLQDLFWMVDSSQWGWIRNRLCCFVSFFIKTIKMGGVVCLFLLLVFCLIKGFLWITFCGGVLHLEVGFSLIVTGLSWLSNVVLRYETVIRRVAWFIVQKKIYYPGHKQ